MLCVLLVGWMGVQCFLRKVSSYDTQRSLYAKIEGVFERENELLGKKYMWVRGYQALWVELMKFTKLA